MGLDQYEVRRWDGWYRHHDGDAGTRVSVRDQTIRPWNRENRGLLRAG